MKCIIIGAGTYGQVYAEYLKNNREYEIAGFLDDNSILNGNVINGISVLGPVSMLEKYQNRDQIAVFVPIGNNTIRTRILFLARSLGYKTPSYIHETSNIHKSVTLGDTVYILAASNIMPLSEIKDNVMISMGVNIAHHTIISNNSFISQGSNIGASIKIDEGVFIGISSTIMTGVKEIGKNSIIGAGAVVIRDVPEDSIVAGVPAKVIKINSVNNE